MADVQKPRIAIMGEFSAGKSTLCNLLLGKRALPEKVTATRLPPVRLSAAPGFNHRVTLDGEEIPVDVDALDNIPFEDTRHVHLFLESKVLEHCDLIDFPGISDPNMDPEVWERVLSDADVVLWLTHATQAWRQSEAAVWDMVSENIQDNSLLLVTRFDKLVSDRDKSRVMSRLDRETDGMFHRVLPISLVDGLASLEDSQGWDTSGARLFEEELRAMIARVSGQPVLETSLIGPDGKAARAEQPVVSIRNQRVVPRRVRVQNRSRGPRPQMGIG